MNLHGLEAAAVLFDCDGVLVDSEPLSYRAWATTLARHGHDLSVDAFTESIGGTDLMVAERFGATVGVPAVTLELEARRPFIELAAEAIPFEDARALLTRLEAEGVPVAVATNGERWRLDPLLRAIALPHLIGRSVTSDEVAAAKPAPDLYEAAARIAGVPPDRCVVVEDSPTGITAARRAGCRVIAVDRGVFDPARLSSADIVVPALAS